MHSTATATRRGFRLAMAQMRVEGGRPAANLARAEACIAEAARGDAHAVLLPEALDIGWTHPDARRLAAPIPEGEPCRRLAEAARRHRLHVVAGLTERAGDRVFNAAVLLGPDGRLLLLHRKLNELEIGHGCYDQGDRLGVVETPLGVIGVMICADAFAPGQVVSRTLGLMGAEVILSPCAWAVPADHDQAREPYGALWRENYGPVARDFRLWIAGVSCVGPIPAGPWAGRKCIGCSLLVGPDGQPRHQAPYGEAAEVLEVVEVRPIPRPARGDGWVRLWAGSRRGDAGVNPD
ncbi:MAG: carbon-nitrogen hydrolase family protein [Verrucomicrobia bacterium]|nr:MAG: carbon-nitrogen hydrolase family protein [Verrucomicrobiota bacterium]